MESSRLIVCNPQRPEERVVRLQRLMATDPDLKRPRARWKESVMMHQECCNWKGRLMCVVGYLWRKFAAGCCCSVGKKGWASRRRSTYWSFKSLGFDEGTEVGLMVIWFEGCLEWRGDCWKLESSQVGLWPTCWHAKPAEGMIVGMILPQSTLIR